MGEAHKFILRLHASCPWPGVRTSRDPGHSGRRPPSLSASLCRAPPPLSSSTSTESLTAPPKDAAFSSLFCFFSISLLFLLLLVALKLRSLRFHSPRLCRVAVFLIQTNVSSSVSYQLYKAAADTKLESPVNCNKSLSKEWQKKICTSRQKNKN